MEYRRLGSAGIKVSEFSLGSWVTYGSQVDVEAAAASIKAAYDAGVNFFDNAEAYAGGRSEAIMGEALRKLSLRRSSYLVSTKTYWGLFDGPNERNSLNRKRLFDAIDGSLKRFGLDYVDFLYCHRADKETPIEETVWAMSDIIASGRALYWGTSEWSAEEIREACDIADRRNLRKPQMEQPQYNLFTRKRVESEYARLYEGVGLGLTTFSPLASGLLSGKYAAGIPEGLEVRSPRLRLAQGTLHEAGTPGGRPPPSPHLEGPRREPGSARPRLVRLEPPRQLRHHRRELPGPGSREHEGR